MGDQVTAYAKLLKCVLIDPLPLVSSQCDCPSAAVLFQLLCCTEVNMFPYVVTSAKIV
jgi:hypothetical protein